MLVLPISKSQVDKLGDRLRDQPDPDPADLELLESVLIVYNQALQIIEDRLRRLGLAPSVRQKVTATIIKKLRRDHGFKLRAIQDLWAPELSSRATTSTFRTPRSTAFVLPAQKASRPRRQSIAGWIPGRGTAPFSEVRTQLHRKLIELSDRVELMGKPA